MEIVGRWWKWEVSILTCRNVTGMKQVGKNFGYGKIRMCMKYQLAGWRVSCLILAHKKKEIQKIGRNEWYWNQLVEKF